MVAILPQNNKGIDYDANARMYIRDLEQGKKPDIRPEFGRWEELIKDLEQSFEPDPDVMQKTIKASRREWPELDALMNVQEDTRFTRGKSGQRIIKLWSIEDLYELPDPTYLITPIFETIEVSMIYAESNTGKSVVALDMALSIAHGIPWCGKATRQGIVWYINTEGKHGFKRRVMGWHKQHEVEPTTAFKAIPWSVDLREDFPVLLDTLYAMKEEGEKPSIIIFDNFSMCADVNQNNQDEVTAILKRLNSLAQDQECHVMFLHHTNKEDDFNGSMAFKNHVDTQIFLKKEDKEDNHSPVVIKNKKARDRELFNPFKFEIQGIELYTDKESLLPVTAPVIVLSEEPLKSPGLHDIPQAMLDILGERTLQYTAWKDECIQTIGMSKPTFDRYKSKVLEAKGYIQKVKPEGTKVEHYRKVPMQGSSDEN